MVASWNCNVAPSGASALLLLNHMWVCFWSACPWIKFFELTNFITRSYYIWKESSFHLRSLSLSLVSDAIDHRRKFFFWIGTWVMSYYVASLESHDSTEDATCAQNNLFSRSSYDPINFRNWYQARDPLSAGDGMNPMSLNLITWKIWYSPFGRTSVGCVNLMTPTSKRTIFQQGTSIFAVAKKLTLLGRELMATPNRHYYLKIKTEKKRHLTLLLLIGRISWITLIWILVH